MVPQGSILHQIAITVQFSLWLRPFSARKIDLLYFLDPENHPSEMFFIHLIDLKYYQVPEGNMAFSINKYLKCQKETFIFISPTRSLCSANGHATSINYIWKVLDL